MGESFCPKCGKAFESDKSSGQIQCRHCNATLQAEALGETLALTPEQAKANVSGVVYEKIEGKTTAYVCRDQTCMPPTNSAEKMLELLKS